MTLNNAALDLPVDGNLTTANINGTTVSASGTTITITSVANVVVPKTIHLISYNSGDGDPYSGLTLAPLPAGYNGSLADNAGSVDLSISPNAQVTSLLWRGAVGSTLNSNWDRTTTDWLNGATPAPYADPNLVHFDDTASNATVIVTTAVGPGVWTVTNSALNYTFEGSGSVTGAVELVKVGTGSLTLKESGGDSFGGSVTVAASGGTVILDDANSTISGGVSIGSGATLQIGNNDANGNLPSASGTVVVNGTLVFDQTSSSTVAAAISGAGGVTQNGSGTVALSGVNPYSGNTTVNAGTLALTGSGAISNSANVTVSGATLDVSGISGVTLLNNFSLANATLTVNATNSPYLQPPVNVASGSLSMSGAGNTINVTALPAILAYPTTITLVECPGSISGYNMTLGTLPASYSGYVSNANNSAVLLVLTNGPTGGVRPYVTWSGVDALNNVSTNWSDALNWQLPGAPVAADNVIFNDTAAQSASAYSAPGGGAADLVPANVNNIVNANFSVSSLTYTNVNNDYQNTFITNGATLTVTNSLAFGSSSSDFGSAAKEYVTVSGANGTLTVNNTNSALFVGLESAVGQGCQATLDMSGLGTFNATVNTFAIGAIATTSLYPSGIAYLAQTNFITAINNTANNESGADETLALMVGQTGKSSSPESYLYLGQQNTINANYIGVGISKQSGEIEFNPTWVNPAVTIRGNDGVSPVTVWAIGDALGQTGSSTAPVGTVDFSGGTVNALVTTMYIGRSPNISGGHAVTGTLTFGAGTISVGTIYDGYQAFSDTDYGVGTINVNGTGLLQVNTLNLALTTGGTGDTSASGTLNISGTVQAGSILGDVVNNAGQSTITLSGGTLTVTNTIGTSAAPLTTLNLNGGTLQLDLNGSSTVTNIVATTVNTNAITPLTIGSIVNIFSPTTVALISYTGTDPYGSLSLNPLPAGYAGHLVDNQANQRVDLDITSAPPQPPVITSISVSGTTLTLNATNGTDNGQFVLLGTTNVALPLSQWKPILTNNFNGSGGLNLVTNIINSSVPHRFYILQVPE